MICGALATRTLPVALFPTVNFPRVTKDHEMTGTASNQVEEAWQLHEFRV